MLAQPGQQARQFLAAVGAAADHPPGRAGVVAGNPDRMVAAVGQHLAGTLAARRHIAGFQRRGVNYPKHRPAPLDQGDIDGEFAVAFNEFLGAVEGVHQPVASLGIGTAKVPGILFRQQRQLRRELGQPGGDKPVGGGIGLGQGRLVGLGRDRKIPAVNGHDGLAGVPGEGVDVGQQAGCEGVGGHRSLHGVH